MRAERTARREEVAGVARAGGLVALLLASSTACSMLVDLDGLTTPGGAEDAGEATDGAAPVLDAEIPPDTSAPADGGEPGDAGERSCPGVGGRAMVAIPAGFCVDVTEVTNDEFAAFLDEIARSGPPSPKPACRNVTSLQPEKWPPPPGRERFPVANVTWCAADAFCGWSGKTLCGARGGGALATTLVNDLAHDAWLVACSEDGARQFPYLGIYRAAACNGDGSQGLDVTPVSSLPGCEGGYPGLSDMSGNVWEWVDSCERALDENDVCLARGGANNSRPEELSCTSRALRLPRGSAAEQVGFRCCAP